MNEIGAFASEFDYGHLKTVFALIETFDEGDMTVGIVLTLENGIVVHEAMEDTDEITCSSEAGNVYSFKEDVSAKNPWKNAIGKRPMWFWKLKQENDYSDAVQYTFANTVEDKELTIQLMVKASAIENYEVTKTL